MMANQAFVGEKKIFWPIVSSEDCQQSSSLETRGAATPTNIGFVTMLNYGDMYGEQRVKSHPDFFVAAHLVSDLKL